jgi:hypothetical protein
MPIGLTALCRFIRCSLGFLQIEVQSYEPYFTSVALAV